MTEEMDHVFDAMDRDNGILVGTPNALSAFDSNGFLRY